VRVVPGIGHQDDELNVHSPIDLEFTYWNFDPTLRLNLSVTITTQEGICAFITTTTLERQWHGKPFPKGLFRSVCSIPADLLNDNVYRVSLLFVKDSTVVLHSEDSVISFEVHDSLTGRDEWYGKWGGVFRPALNWTTELVESQREATVSR
jgi:lipopolysaccharide transport system ATP-binding protein